MRFKSLHYIYFIIIAVFLANTSSAAQLCNLAGFKAAIQAGGNQVLGCTSPTTITLDQSLTINVDLNLQGNTAIIHGDNKYCYTIANRTVTFSNMTFTTHAVCASSSSYRGVFQLTNSLFTIQYVNITNGKRGGSTANYHIYGVNSILFINNSASFNEGVGMWLTRGDYSKIYITSSTVLSDATATVVDGSSTDIFVTNSYLGKYFPRSLNIQMSNCIYMGPGNTNFVSLGNNIVTTTPTHPTDIALSNFYMGPFGVHRGLTPSFTLLAGGPAINSAFSFDPPLYDQTGATRIQQGAMDRGPYESNFLPGVTLLSPSVSVLENASFAIITISRPYPSYSSVTVNIVVQQGTAQAGIDYNATSIPSSVTWIYEDDNNKIISIQLHNPDRLIKPSRSFALVFTSTSATLLNGPPGNVVSQLVLNITIDDDDLACYDDLNCHSNGACNSQNLCDCFMGYNITNNCSSCSEDYYNYPNCSYCGPLSCEEGYCNKLGGCTCNSEVFDTATNCSTCAENYYIFPFCNYCNSDTCSHHGTCDSNGTCVCEDFIDPASNCSLCTENRYNYPLCSYCEPRSCHNGYCNNTGGCTCYSIIFDPASNCSTCAENYFNFPLCSYCDSNTCNNHGTCEPNNGTCICEDFLDPTTNCSTCLDNHYNHPLCSYCDPVSCGEGYCNKTGGCTCNSEAFDPATNCSKCSENYYNHPLCTYCDANTCNNHGKCGNDGICICEDFLDPISNCSTCLDNYYNHPLCFYCEANSTCHSHGTCTNNETCLCNENYDPSTNCSECIDNHYNYPLCSYCGEDTCNFHGQCNATGLCECAPTFDESTNCSNCSLNHFNYPACTYCDTKICDDHGECNAMGLCDCDIPFDSSTNCSSCSAGYFNYPDCTYCEDTITCTAMGSCNGRGECVCDSERIDNSSNCFTCISNYFNYPACDLYCDTETNCSGQGICNNEGVCECDTEFAGKNCSFYSIPSPICSLSASVIARPNASWSLDNITYQLYDFVVMNQDSKSLFSVIVFLGNTSGITQLWNLNIQNKTYLSSNNSVLSYEVNNYYQLSPNESYSGAGFVVAGSGIPFVVQASCSNQSVTPLQAGCSGLLVSSQIRNGSTYIQEGVLYSQYTISILNIGQASLSQIVINITTTNGSSIDNQSVYNLTLLDNLLYDVSLFGTIFKPGTSYNETSGFTLVGAGSAIVQCYYVTSPATEIESTRSNSKNIGIIVGAVIGGVVGLALLAGLVLFGVRHHKKKHNKVPSFDTTVTGGNRGKAKFGISALGSGYSKRNLQFENDDL